jgi:UDP-N-acetylglucosamine 2-epimerase (non-hydrolysing)
MRREGTTCVRVVDTGQHPDRVGEALAPFGLVADAVLSPRRRAGSLSELAMELMTAADEVLIRHPPAAVVVQGDTLTALIGGLVAFWHRIPVVHLEAGLRSHDLGRPFPEEANRAMLARFASLHLAPTAAARTHLINEGVPAGTIVVTGNTVVDALRYLLDNDLARPPSWLDRSRPLLIATAHRRENWGAGIAGIATALGTLADHHRDLQIVMVAHPNPAMRAQLSKLLGGVPGVRLTPPLPYPAMIGLLDRAELIITDSGGIQEEAATMGVPLLVTRDSTERPEAVAAGAGELVGTVPGRIVAAAERYLWAGGGRPRDVAMSSLFGDGRAAARAGQAIAGLLDRIASGDIPMARSSPPDRQPQTAGLS